MGQVEGEDPRETSGLTVRLVVSYVRSVAGDEGVRELLRRSGETRPLEVLENEREWCSYDAKIALFRAASEVTGRPDVGLRIGSHAFESTVGPSVRLMLSMFGSPAGLLRHVAHANGKFTQCADLTATILSSTSATAVYRLHDGYAPSRFDCDYTRGMLAQIPPMFGLPPATVRHEECQIDGAPACVYLLRWSRRRRWWGRRRADRAVDARVVHDRLQELQHAVTDLVGRNDLDVDAVLARVVERAAFAVTARAFILAAQLEPEAAPVVHAQGLGPDPAQRIGEALLLGHTQPVDDYVIAAPVRLGRTGLRGPRGAGRRALPPRRAGAPPGVRRAGRRCARRRRREARERGSPTDCGDPPGVRRRHRCGSAEQRRGPRCDPGPPHSLPRRHRLRPAHRT